MSFVKATGDRTIETMRFAVNDPQYSAWLLTTWSELEAAGLLTAKHLFGNPGYGLTPTGWLEGLRLLGELDRDTQTWQRAQALARILKGQITGRNQIHDALVDPR